MLSNWGLKLNLILLLNVVFFVIHLFHWRPLHCQLLIYFKKTNVFVKCISVIYMQYGFLVLLLNLQSMWNEQCRNFLMLNKTIVKISKLKHQFKHLCILKFHTYVSLDLVSSVQQVFLFISLFCYLH